MRLAHEPAQERALVIRVERSQRSGELLLAILVGALQLFAQASEKARNGPVLGERIERANELRVTLTHHRAQLLFEDHDEAGTLRGTQRTEQRTRFAHLARERLREHAVLRPEVLVEQARQHAM